MEKNEIHEGDRVLVFIAKKVYTQRWKSENKSARSLHCTIFVSKGNCRASE
jgi:hypothetical protein